jgi:hypothetical protein
MGDVPAYLRAEGGAIAVYLLGSVLDPPAGPPQLPATRRMVENRKAIFFL